MALDLEQHWHVYTVADLLALRPLRYEDPAPSATIAQLESGYPAVVRGRVRSNVRELAEVPDLVRRATITITTITDTSPLPLRLRWVELRNDIPAGLYPDTMVVVFGTPHRVQWREGLLSRRIMISMDDPLLAVGTESTPPPPTPGIDAPFVRYVAGPTHIDRGIRSAIAQILPALAVEDVTLSDGSRASGEQLHHAIWAIHRPVSTEQRDWGWTYLDWLVAVLKSAQPPRPPPPQARLIKTPEDAERYAAEFLASLGYPGVGTTPIGRDGGVDVRGPTVVAQVKLEGVKTDVQKLQALSGIASHERKYAAFFSLSGYTQPSIDWAEQVGMALFEFDYSGVIKGCSSMARRLQVHGVH